MAASSKSIQFDCQMCLKDPSHIIYHNLSKVNAEINRMEKRDLVEMLKHLHIDTGGSVDVLRKRLKAHKKKQLLGKSCNNLKFEYICVIDFEATCEDKVAEYPHEIIEFPAVLIDVKTVTIVDEFQRYCKPVINPILSQFCTNLTGISQKDVDNSEEFPEIFATFENWLGKHKLHTDHTFVIATDGPCDVSKFLKTQCEYSNILFPSYAESWINVRKSFSNFYKTKRKNISSMLDFLGLQFEGSQHCGLHDSRNLARIILRMVNDGAHLKCNDRLSDTTILAQPTLPQKSKTSRQTDPEDNILDISKSNPNDYLGVDPENLGDEMLLVSYK